MNKNYFLKNPEKYIKPIQVEINTAIDRNGHVLTRIVENPPLVSNINRKYQDIVSFFEGKLDKIEKQLADNIIYDWAKQPKKPTYTPEEIGAEKAGAADGILNNAIKYTDGEISRLEDIVIPTKIAELNDKKAEKVHSHLVSDITDFPTSLPASDVHEWAKARTKPSYAYDEVGALSKDAHIPSTLSEMTSDENHRIVTDKEKASWNAKSNFSGSYNDLTDIPEIKQLTDELKKKYDDVK